MCCFRIQAPKVLTCTFECLKKTRVLMSLKQWGWYMGSAGVLLSEMYKICGISLKGLQAWNEEKSVCNLAHELMCIQRTASCIVISKHAGMNWTLSLLEDKCCAYVCMPTCMRLLRVLVFFFFFLFSFSVQCLCFIWLCICFLIGPV